MPEMTTLDKMRPGDSGIVERYEGEKDLHHRLKELGLVQGTGLCVKRLAPLGDPMEIRVRGYDLSIRKEDAAHLVIQRTGSCACVKRHRHGGGS